MKEMMNQSIFEEIFDKVMIEKGITAWWDLFDSSEYDEVIIRIGKRFGYETEDTEILFDELGETLEGFTEWHNTMAMDL